MHDPPKFNQGGQINSSVFAGDRDTMQNGAAEAVICNSKVVKIMKDICPGCFILSCMDGICTIILILGIDISIYSHYLR